MIPKDPPSNGPKVGARNQPLLLLMHYTSQPFNPHHGDNMKRILHELLMCHSLQIHGSQEPQAYCHT